MNDLTKMKIIVVLLSATTLITAMNLNRFQKIMIEYHECNNRIVAKDEIERLKEKDRVRSESASDEIVAACTACYKKDKLN